MDGFSVFLGVVFAGVCAAAIRRPRGIYRRAATYGLASSAGALVLSLVAALVLGPNSGLGLAILLYGFWFLVILTSAAALVGATSRHFWNALRR